MNLKTYISCTAATIMVSTAIIGNSISDKITKANNNIANVDAHISKGDSTIIAKMNSTMKSHDKAYQVTIAQLEAKSASEKLALKKEMVELKQELKSLSHQIASTDTISKIAKRL